MAIYLKVYVWDFKWRHKAISHIFMIFPSISTSSLGDCDVSKLKSLKLGCGVVLGHHPAGQTFKWRFLKQIGPGIVLRRSFWPLIAEMSGLFHCHGRRNLAVKKLSSPTCCKVNEIVQVCWAMGGFVWQSRIFSSELQLGLHVASDSQLEGLGATLY